MAVNLATGTGRRKTSVARVYLREGSGKITINGREIENYFPNQILSFICQQPLAVTDNEGKFARHVDAGPDYVRTYNQPKDQCIYGRFKDSDYMGDPQIMLCPILASRLSWFIGTGRDKSVLTPFRSLEDINDNSPHYANWNYQLAI